MTVVTAIMHRRHRAGPRRLAWVVTVANVYLLQRKRTFLKIRIKKRCGPPLHSRYSTHLADAIVLYQDIKIGVPHIAYFLEFRDAVINGSHLQLQIPLRILRRQAFKAFKFVQAREEDTLIRFASEYGYDDFHFDFHDIPVRLDPDCISKPPH